MVALPPSDDSESPAANEAPPALAAAEVPACNETAPPVESPEPTVRAMPPPDADVERPGAMDMAPEVAMDELPVARLRLPLKDPALLPAASAVTKLAVPELASSLAPDVIDTIPPPEEEPEPAEMVMEPP